MAAHALLLLLLVCGAGSHGAAQRLESVPDLEAAMYHQVVASPCVRLLTVSGEVGCANPGRLPVAAPLQRFVSANDKLTEVKSRTVAGGKSKVAVLLPSTEFSAFLQRTLDEPTLSNQVAGVLVEYGPGGAFSPAANFPQAAFAPYEDRSYNWNPEGTGLQGRRFDFPIFALSPEATSALQTEAASNEARNFRHPLHVAEFGLVMQTTKSETDTSATCLEGFTCLPLGGYSVLSALPPMTAQQEKPWVLAVAAMDAASFFRDLAPGADSPISGLVALLAAVDALSRVPHLDDLPNQLAFLVPTGEAWGFLGSRRFLREIETNGPSVAGLNSSLLRQVLEIGSVGRARTAGKRVQFFVHQDKSQRMVNERADDIIKALQEAAASLDTTAGAVKVAVQAASTATPGVPPSSLWSFLHANPGLAGAVLEEFDDAFLNSNFQSRFDDFAQVASDPSPTFGAASLAARTLYLLAGGSATTAASISVNRTLVAELFTCLLDPLVGFDCQLAQGLMTPSSGPSAPDHYVGVFSAQPELNPDPSATGDTARFIWNFLANRTGRFPASAPATSTPGAHPGLRKEELDLTIGKGNGESGGDCVDSCHNPEEVCSGSTVKRRGHCVVSTTRYVPAYSPRLVHDEVGWSLLPLEAGGSPSATAADSADPVWTESFWQTLQLRSFLQDDPHHESNVLSLGLFMTLATLVAAAVSNTLLQKRVKVQ